MSRSAACGLAIVLTLATVAVAVEPIPPFDVIRPILQSRCIDCHGPDEKNADVDLSKLTDENAAARARKMLRKTIAQVEAGQMPPADADPLSPEQRETLLAWLSATVNNFDCPDTIIGDPGPSVAHRLSLAEYNNTVRDLLGIDFDAGQLVGIPSDVMEHGYGKLAEGLTLSPALLDKYFAAADKALDRFFGTELSSQIDWNFIERAKRSKELLVGKPPEAPEEQREHARKVIARLLPRAYRRPVSEQEVDEVMALFDRASKRQKGFEDALRVAIKGALVSPHFLFRIGVDSAADRAGQAIRVNDHELASRLSYFLWSSMPDDRLLDLADRHKLTAPGPSQEPVKFAGTLIGAPGSESFTGNGRDKVFDGDLFTFLDGSTADSFWVGLDLGEPKPISQVRYFPRRGHAFRLAGGKVEGSSTVDFSSDVVTLVEITAAPTSDDWTTVTIDPARQLRYVRYVPPKNSFGNIAELEFWGQAEGTVLQQQVWRMLADPKARALTDQFAVNWLKISKLPTARPTTEFFPTFTPDLKQAMFDETFLFFDKLRSEDRSLLELLDADYTFANDKLAEHYGIAGVSGKEMRRVSLAADSHRGGLLGMGSILSINSHTFRTSPTLRGKWILEVLFGSPPPPPPANAGMIKEEQDKQNPKSFREQLAAHASNAQCASCHKRMDPLGFALDNFSAVGSWRTDSGGLPLDTSGELPTGQKFNGVDELKRVLKARQADFVRNLTEQMFVFALGRELDYDDDCPVKRTTTRLERDGYKFSSLVLGIVESYPFQYRSSGK